MKKMKSMGPTKNGIIKATRISTILEQKLRCFCEGSEMAQPDAIRFLLNQACNHFHVMAAEAGGYDNINFMSMALR